MDNAATNSTVCQVKIEGEMTIYSALDTKERLISALARHNQVEIDLSHVSEMDSAGLQLMILAKREAAAKNKQIRFVSHSPAVVEVLELCNLMGYFGDPVVLPSKTS